jgi:Na+-transporting methylmalonyl-CoA/oxaloacetate decarboxylase gamma subunit
VETAVGIVLIVLSLLIIVGIIRTVQANMVR